uniref:NADH-ubiquinone oxidoreductase chain 6 n=1 Tax=Theodoxus fluviatilis TaxID=120472 RepID=A0A1B2G3F5_9GAST|nr:NADH dehydrogenase subunit 6 [Theodoxus fluviatilis]
MTMCIISSLLLSLIFSMPMMMQPFSLGLCIMAISLFWCILLGFTYSSWFSYVLFLIYVGGLLVMFVYVAALAPNTLFSSLKSLTSTMSAAFVLFIIIISLTSKDLSFLYDTLSSDYCNESMKTGILMTSSSNISMLIGLGLILLMNLLAVVKVCYYQQGPLRPYNELN